MNGYRVTKHSVEGVSRRGRPQKTGKDSTSLLKKSWKRWKRNCMVVFSHVTWKGCGWWSWWKCEVNR